MYVKVWKVKKNIKTTMKRGKRRIQKVWILLNTTELKQTKPANSPINSKLTKLMREKVSRNERSRELQKKENPCKIQSKQKKKA